MVRCKFKVESYTTRLITSQSSPPEEVRQVKMNVVYGDSPENKEFFKWTPSGEIVVGMLNQKAWEQFELGKEYYVDFTSVEQSVNPDSKVTAGTIFVKQLTGSSTNVTDSKINTLK